MTEKEEDEQVEAELSFARYAAVMMMKRSVETEREHILSSRCMQGDYDIHGYCCRRRG